MSLARSVVEAVLGHDRHTKGGDYSTRWRDTIIERRPTSPGHGKIVIAIHRIASSKIELIAVGRVEHPRCDELRIIWLANPIRVYNITVRIKVALLNICKL